MFSWVGDKESNFALKKAEDFSLENMKKALEILGNPHEKLKNVIHIAGTNGKGSTTTFLWNILRCAGYKVHKYTSPHILKFNERITIYDKDISDLELENLSSYCREKIGHLGLTFFEVTTLIAFLAFEKNSADFVVLETGLGGKFDSTNVFSEKLCAIITSISLDHTQILGNNLEDIAQNKAGILPSAKYKILSKSAADLIKNEDCYAYDRSFQTQGSFLDFSFKFPDCTSDFQNLTSGIQGDHNLENASLAIAAALIISNSGYEISENSIRLGLKNAYIPYRIQKISGNLLNKFQAKGRGADFYLDVSHNQDSIQKLCDFVQKYLKNVERIGIFSILKDKNSPDLYKILQNIGFKKLYIAEIKGNIRAELPENILENIAKYTNIDAEIVEDIPELLRNLCQNSSPEGKDVLIFGSIYFISGVCEIFS